MIISIKAKLNEMGYNIEDVGLELEAAFKTAVGDVAVAAHDEWKRLAQHRLNTSRADYLNGLNQAESFKQLKDIGSTAVFEITLVGRMPNNFEFGMPSFDMKGVRPGWLGGSKALTAKDGHKYIVIPFRHSMTSTTNLAYSGQAKAADLQSLLKRTVKEYGLNRLIKTATGAAAAGPVKRIPAGAPVHPFLKGLTRIQQPSTAPRKSGGAQLMTWRVMSENSPAGSWNHPGIPPANLLEEVEQYVDNAIAELINRMMRVA